MCRIITFLTMAMALTFVSCQGNQKKVQAEEAKAEVKVEAAVLTPEKVMAEGATLVGKEVSIKGTVNHVCRHGGKKCRLAGTTEGAWVQVMARGEIKEFAKELIGSEIVVKGTVKERKITKEMVAEQEKAAKSAMEKAETKEAKHMCSHSMGNVEKMKQWMADNNKDYYAVYFVEGVSFEKVQK